MIKQRYNTTINALIKLKPVDKKCDDVNKVYDLWSSTRTIESCLSQATYFFGDREDVCYMVESSREFVMITLKE